MVKAESTELVPRKYHRGGILLSIQRLSEKKEGMQPQLCELAECVDHKDNSLLIIIISKLDPYFNRSRNILIDYATDVSKFDQNVAEAAFDRLCDMKDWRERKSIWRKIVYCRTLRDVTWNKAQASLYSLEVRIVELVEFKAAKDKKQKGGR